MSELGERMSCAMCLRGMAARTQEAYIGAVADLAMPYHRSPAELRVEEVQAYLLHLVRDRKLACASVNQASCALRFLYRRVLGRPEAGFDIPMAKVPKRLPQSKRPAGPPTNPVPVAAPSRGFHGRARWARLAKWQRTGEGM